MDEYQLNYTREIYPIPTFSSYYEENIYEFSLLYLLRTNDGENLEVLLEVGVFKGYEWFRTNLAVSGYQGSTPDKLYLAFGNDPFHNFIQVPFDTDPMGQKEWSYPVYHYGLHEMVDTQYLPQYDDNGCFLGWISS